MWNTTRRDRAEGSISLNFTVEWIDFLLHIRENTDSKLGSETYCPYCVLSVFFRSLWLKSRQYIKLGRMRFVYILTGSLFGNRITIRHCTHICLMQGFRSLFFTFSSVRLVLGFDARGASSMPSLPSRNTAYHKKMFERLKQSLLYTLFIISYASSAVLGSSWIAVQLAASQGGLSSMKLV
jgi:hypothetical protein